MITVISVFPWLFVTIGGALIVNEVLLAYGPIRRISLSDTPSALALWSRWVWPVTSGAFLMIGGVAGLLVSSSGSP